MQVFDLRFEISEVSAVYIVVLKQTEEKITIGENAKELIRLFGSDDNVANFSLLEDIYDGGEVIRCLFTKPLLQ